MLMRNVSEAKDIIAKNIFRKLMQNCKNLQQRSITEPVNPFLQENLRVECFNRATRLCGMLMLWKANSAYQYPFSNSML